MNGVRSRTHLGVPASGSVLRQRRGLGSAEPESKEETSTLEIALPIVKTLLDSSAVKDVEVLRARATNFKRLRDRTRKGSIAWTLYDNQYRVTLAKLRAAEVEKKQELEDRASKLEVVGLGKVGITVGIVGGVALIALLVKLAGAAGRHGR